MIVIFDSAFDLTNTLSDYCLSIYTMLVNAQPAPPLLGSNILAAARAHESTRPAPASSGSAALDEGALSGGFRYGEITSIAGASATGKTLVGRNDVLISGLVSLFSAVH